MLAAGQSVRHLSAAAHHSPSVGLCGPAVKLLLIQYGIDAKDVKATGPKKNILKSDLLSLISSKNLKPVPVKVSPPADPVSTGKPVAASAPAAAKKAIGSARNVDKFVDIPLTNIRATIAKRLAQSKQSTPHEYQSADVKADAITNLRAQLKKDKIALSLNDFIVKASALALRAVPEINVRWSEAGPVPLPTVDVSVAVATPSGLITPIVTNADIRGIRDISNNVKALAVRAKENKLQPNEFQGGSFTISNLGMFGSVNNFTAIINPPQTAILTVGGSRVEINGELQPETKFTVTLCYDGRAISPSAAQRFLDHVSASLSDPDFMVSEPIDPALDFDFARLL